MGAATTDGQRSARVIAGLALAILAFVAVSVAATGGPVPVAVEGSGGWFVFGPESDGDGPGPATAERDGPIAEPGDSTTSDVVSLLIEIAVIVVIAAAIYLLGRLVRRAVGPSAPDAQPGVPVPAPPTGTRELVDAVDDSLAALAEGPIDDVIIACWVRLEDAAGAAGVARRPWETPAELTVRVLARFDVPGAAIDRLLTRYRTARYSRHRLGEDDRAVAIAALREIRTAIGPVRA